MSRLLQHPWCRKHGGDAVSVLLLLALSSYLMRPLFDWDHRVLTSDLAGSWTWFYWLKQSVLTFHQYPTWSPLWMGGMPFFGIVPPAGYLLVLPAYLITGDVLTAYSLATIIAFSLAGLSMHAYLKQLSRNSLASFLGAIIYVTIPVHANSMMFWGHFEIMCAYALIPLVLLSTDRFLDGRGQVYLVVLGLLVSLVLLFQIEYSLIFLLFYICYLAFSLAIRHMGPRAWPGLIRRNKLGTAMCLLILLVPLGFYLITLSQYGRFGGLTTEQVQVGLNVYTLKHFGDAFQTRLAGGLDGYFKTPAADYYSGGLSFVVLLAATGFALLERNGRRAQILFFLIAGLSSLILAMGIFGPLFPPLRRIIPLLSGMRAPLRFYYIFALCLPVLFTLSFMAFARLVEGLGFKTARLPRLVANGFPILLVAILMLDISPYFSFYHHRVVDKAAYNAVSDFLEERVAEDRLPGDGPCRVLVVPDGSLPDRVSRMEQSPEGDSVLEISQSWVTWAQYEAAADYNSSVYRRIFRDSDSLAFYCQLLSYDYVMVYDLKLPPPQAAPEYLADLVETLDSLCLGESPTLADRGSLDNEYYAVRLYRVNGGDSSKVRFHSLDKSLFVDNGDLYATHALGEAYGEMGRGITPEAFLRNIVAINAEEELPEAVTHDLAAIHGLCVYRGEPLLLGDDSRAVQVLDRASCKTNGWADALREDSQGFPDSGCNLAVTNVTAAPENYLLCPFVVEDAGGWVLNLAYFSDVATGYLEILIDGRQVAVVDTSGQAPATRYFRADLALGKGPHELKLIARPSYITFALDGGAQRVEVGRISLLARDELPAVLASSRALWSRLSGACDGDESSSAVSNLSLSPRGISLDVDVAEAGILSVAYYDNPWWQIYVDGEKARPITINGVFPGVVIADGQHHVDFVYDYP